MIILKNNGYNSYNAYSGTEALLLLLEKKYDLMLLGLNGEEIIKKVDNIPIIVISAKVS